MAEIARADLPGIRNFATVESAVACAGAITPEAIAGIRKMGYRSIINLRLPGESGADVAIHMAAAEAAGIRYVHIPFSSANPDPAAVDAFLEVITEPGSSPAFVHCAGGGRAAGMWLMKRVMVDRWDVDKALEEAALLGLVNPAVRSFMLGEIERRRT